MPSILFLTQYYLPESGAPQQRLSSLAGHLQRLGWECHVLTCHPHYPKMHLYAGYDNQNFISETLQSVQVFRVPVYIPKKKNFVFRVFNYFSFVVQSVRFASRLPLKSYDFIFCESPPLFLGISALRLKKKYNAKLIFNVSDLWPESIVKLGITSNPLFLWPLWKLESLMYRNSYLVTGQTLGICRNIQERFPSVQTFWLPNGADPDKWKPEIFNKSECRKQWNIKENVFVVGYAGILGLAQGLHHVIACAERAKDKNYLFIVAGDGPEHEKLQTLIEKKHLHNVRLLGHIDPKDMACLIRSFDVALVPLKKSDLFLSAIPSKLFENLAMEVPVLMAVDGEAREIFEKTHKSVFFIEPENPDDWMKILESIRLNPNVVLERVINGKRLIQTDFNRKFTAEKFHRRLTAC